MHETLRTTVTIGASTGVDALYALQRQVRPSQRKQRPTPAREKRIMSARSIIGAACAILAITTSAVAHGPGDAVTPHFEHAIPCDQFRFAAADCFRGDASSANSASL